MANNVNPPDNQKELNKLNIIMGIIIVFIIVWGTWRLYQTNLTDDTHSESEPPVMIMDYLTGQFTNTSNFILPDLNFSITNQFQIPDSNFKTNVPSVKPYFETKKSYKKMEYVIINYYYVPALVLESDGDDYTVLYRDRNRVLQKITLPREMLLTPTSNYVVDPLSLLNE